MGAFRIPTLPPVRAPRHHPATRACPASPPNHPCDPCPIPPPRVRAPHHRPAARAIPTLPRLAVCVSHPLAHLH